MKAILNNTAGEIRETIESGDGWEIVEVKRADVTTAAGAKRIFEAMAGDDIDKQELFLVIALDGASKVLYTKIIFKGTLNQSLVHPREVFSDAIRERAAGIIIAHNHPSDTASPSRADRQITDRLKESGKILGIELLDHIIVTPSGNYFSFSDDGLI
jgi:DNA repair protein RadC